MNDRKEMTNPDVRPYIIKTYDRWIILAIVLIVANFAFTPIFAYVTYFRGVTFERTFHVAEAMHYYQKATVEYKRIPEPWWSMGEIYLMDIHAHPEHVDAAVRTLQEGLSYNPTDPTIALTLGLAYYWGRRDWNAALENFALAAREDPTSRAANDYAAWSAWYSGKPTIAIGYWKKVLALHPADTITQHNLSQAEKGLLNRIPPPVPR